jgi:hypothetical protein
MLMERYPVRVVTVFTFKVLLNCQEKAGVAYRFKDLGQILLRNLNQMRVLSVGIIQFMV